MEFVHKLQGEGYSLASILDALNNFMAATDDDYAATIALDAWAPAYMAFCCQPLVSFSVDVDDILASDEGKFWCLSDFHSLPLPEDMDTEGLVGELIVSPLARRNELDT
jgi:hypothetical protein